ncbi:MAG: dihydrodipicolinate synthase family protein [bacterium]
MELSGIHCPITTPFVDKKIAPDKLAHNLEKWNETGLAGYVVFGSTGEAPYVSISERLELLRTARRYIPSEKTFIVGSGFETTDETINFTQRAAETGPDAALVLTPNYYKQQMTDDVFRRHFLAVAEKSPIPVLIYNVPIFTGIDISASVVKELSEHPNIIGIKDSSARLAKLLRVIEMSSQQFQVFVGNAASFFHGIYMGADGAVLALANVAPAQCVQIFEDCRNACHDAARQLFLRILPFATDVIVPYGIPAIKAAQDALGYFGGDPRAPLLPVVGPVGEKVVEELSKAGIL